MQNSRSLKEAFDCSWFVIIWLWEEGNGGLPNKVELWGLGGGWKAENLTVKITTSFATNPESFYLFLIRAGTSRILSRCVTTKTVT